MIEVISQQGRHIQIISQSELRAPLSTGDYIRAYCHIHGSDHQRSLSINRRTGWGHCFNATCEAIVLVAEWNPEVTGHLLSVHDRGVQTFGDNTCHPEPFASLKGKLREGSGSTDAEILPLRYAQGFGSLAQDDIARKRGPFVVQPVLLLPSPIPPQWQQEERHALLVLDKPMRKALVQSKRAHLYLHERGIPLHVAQAAGVGYLPAELLRSPEVREQRTLLHRWTDRLLFPLHTPDGQGYIGRSLWRWVPGMDEYSHKSLLDQQKSPRRWIKTNPAGWFGYNPDHHPGSIILVEGAFDRLALLAAGMASREVVALAGTAIRPDWFPAHVSTVILALDSDAGGNSATDRLVERLDLAGIGVEVCPPLQDRWGKDWSERWRKLGPASVQPLFELHSALVRQMTMKKKGA